MADSYSGPAVVGTRLYVMDRPQAAEPQPKPGEENPPKPAARERVLCLDATTGKTIWEHAYARAYNIGYPEGPRTTPTVSDGRVFTLGAMGDLLCLRADTGEVVWARDFLKWNRRSTSGTEMNDGLHTVLGTPVFKDGFIYGVCGFGELRCLDAKTGERKWETYAATVGKKAFFANVFITENEDRASLYNDQGELIIAKLRPEGYEELSRAKLLEPLHKTRGRTVTWCHPAYANRRAYLHNGRDLICVFLADESSSQS